MPPDDPPTAGRILESDNPVDLSKAPFRLSLHDNAASTQWSVASGIQTIIKRRNLPMRPTKRGVYPDLIKGIGQIWLFGVRPPALQALDHIACHAHSTEHRVGFGDGEAGPSPTASTYSA